MEKKIKELEKIIKYNFKKPSILEKALTHKSLNNDVNNEKLEFLGDRVLGLVISQTLLEKYPDEIYCMWFNDAWESQKFCTFPIVSKRWVKELGYFMFPFFQHFFIDTWVWMLAKSVDRAIYISDILVEHRHWKTGKAEKDETYNRNMTTATNSKHARDREIMDKFERYFVADVGLLEGLIANKEN